MRCYNCSNDVSEGEGYWVGQGFVCRVCADALDFLPCTKCGRRSKRSDMIEWDDKFYCRDCARIAKPIVRLRPIAKFRGGAMIPRNTGSKQKALKDIEPGLLRDLQGAIKREEDAETADKFKEISSEIRGETKEIDEKDKDIDSLEELKALGDKLKEARNKKKKQDDEDYSLKGE